MIFPVACGCVSLVGDANLNGRKGGRFLLIDLGEVWVSTEEVCLSALIHTCIHAILSTVEDKARKNLHRKKSINRLIWVYWVSDTKGKRGSIQGEGKKMSIIALPFPQLSH